MFLRAVLPAIVIALAAFFYFAVMNLGLLGVRKAEPELIKAPASLDGPESALRVSTLTLTPRHFKSTVRLGGVTRANAKITVRTEIGGIVEELPIRHGSRVEKGELVALLNEGTRLSELEKAQAQLKTVNADLRAKEKLAQKGFSSQIDLVSAQAALETAKAEVKAAQLAYDDIQIFAPQGGFVQERYVELGDLLQPASPVMQIVDTQPIIIEAMIGQRVVSQLRAGQNAEIELATGKRFTAKLRYISSVALDETRTFKLEFEAPNSDGSLVEGLATRVKITLPHVKSHYIPSSSLTLNSTGKIGVKLVQNGRVAFTPVIILESGAGGVWLTGLPDKATLIIKGQEYAKDGQSVEATALSPQEILAYAQYIEEVER